MGAVLIANDSDTPGHIRAIEPLNIGIATLQTPIGAHSCENEQHLEFWA